MQDGWAIWFLQEGALEQVVPCQAASEDPSLLAGVGLVEPASEERLQSVQAVVWWVWWGLLPIFERKYRVVDKAVQVRLSRGRGDLFAQVGLPVQRPLLQRNSSGEVEKIWKWVETIYLRKKQDISKVEILGYI